LFDVPAEYTAKSRKVPTAEEVAPWIQTIIRLWDDQPYYEAESARALAASRRFHPDNVIPLHEQVLQKAMQSARPPPTALRPLPEDLAALEPLFAQPPDFKGFAPLPAELNALISG
jgi:hypothetical protein